MITSADVRAVKQSIIKGKWGKGFHYDYFSTGNIYPLCLMGHVERVFKEPLMTGRKYKEFNVGFFHMFGLFPIHFNDNIKTTRWDVIAKLGEMQRALEAKEKNNDCP